MISLKAEVPYTTVREERPRSQGPPVGYPVLDILVSVTVRGRGYSVDCQWAWVTVIMLVDVPLRLRPKLDGALMRHDSRPSRFFKPSSLMLEKQGANISCPPRSRRYNNSEGGDKNSLVLKRAFGFNRQQLEQNCFGTESWLELSRWPWLGPAGHRDRDCESDWLRFRLAGTVTCDIRILSASVVQVVNCTGTKPFFNCCQC